MRRIAVLASGRGSNLQALIDVQAQGALGGRIVLVVSEKSGAAALGRSERAGIPTDVIRIRDFPDRGAWDRAVALRLRAASAEVVVLAGFNRVLGPAVLAEFPGRILNVHPSLLPAFPGSLHAQRSAIEYGVKVSGCTVHLVNDELDAGPIVMQRAVEVRDDDTEESLSARILVEEHRALPQAVRLLCEDRLRVVGRRVTVLPARPLPV